jgi:glucose/arabinose dehydrogenase
MTSVTIVMSTLMLAAVWAAGPSTTVLALPSGFSDSLVTTVDKPTAVEPLIDGRVVVLEQATGRVRIIDAASGALAPNAAIDLDVCVGGERGLLGFTDDPAFGRNGRVYAFYTRTAPEAPNGCVNRVSAFTMSGNAIDPASEQVLIDNISSVNGNHNAGDLEIGNDGFLYITTGDAGRDPRGNSGSAGSNDAAQDLSLLNGKILRLDRFTGAPAPGNPIADAGSVACGSRGNTPATPSTSCQEIYAWGLRNPFRFAFDPNTSATRFFINDVGQGTREEVDLGQAGANYGWNSREGQCPQAQNPPCAGPAFGLTDPITDYDHTVGSYITGGAFVPNGGWPAEFDGGYLFADGGSGKIWLRRADGTVDYANPFSTGQFGLADMAFVMEPQGWALYYTLSGSGQVHKITVALPAPAASGPQRFQPLATLDRVFDSRTLSPTAPIRGGQTRLIDVKAPAGATAALVNLTLVQPFGTSFATVWQPRTQRPATSNVNALDAEVVANSSIVPLDANGRLLVFVRATSDVIVDVGGFYVPSPNATTAGRFASLDPQRLIDTRQPASASNEFTRGPGAADTQIVKVPVAGRRGVPATGAASVALIVTGVSTARSAAGYATLYAGGTAVPNASNLNVNIGDDVRANLAIVPIGADGTIEVLTYQMDDVLLDVAGWFSGAGSPSSTAGRFTLLPPTRAADSRVPIGFGPLGDESTVTLNPAVVPDGASAIAQNLTLAPSTNWGYVTAFPGGVLPVVSNVNSTAGGQTRAALAFTKLAGGTESLYAYRATQLLVDVFGYYE